MDLSKIRTRDWYGNGDQIAQIIKQVYQTNIYLKKIEIERIVVSDKMLADVLKSRNKIYRDSATIVRLYQELMALEPDHMRDLFSETFIEMQDINEVFELYCIFKYLRERFDKETVTYHMIDSEAKYLASLEDDHYLYKIYHNRTARDYLKFQIEQSEIENTDNVYLNRKVSILRRKNKIMQKLGQKTTTNVWQGRPDLIIMKLKKADETIEAVEIGEVKYTKNLNYLATGLEELLEYMYLIKNGNQFIAQEQIKGLLFVDNMPLVENTFENIEIKNQRSQL